MPKFDGFWISTPTLVMFSTAGVTIKVKLSRLPKTFPTPLSIAYEALQQILHVSKVLDSCPLDLIGHHSTSSLMVLHTRSAVTNLYIDKEYVKPAEFSIIQTVASRVGSALSAAAGRTYAVIQSSNLYATSGSTTDYAYGRHLKDAALNV